MDHRPYFFRDLPPWVWKVYAGILFLAIIYLLVAWLWEELAG